MSIRLASHIIYSQVLSSVLNAQVLSFTVSLVYLCVVLLVQCPRANWLSNRLYTNQRASSRRGLSDVTHRPTSSPWWLVCWHTVQVTQRLSANHNPLRYTTPNTHLLHIYNIVQSLHMWYYSMQFAFIPWKHLTFDICLFTCALGTPLLITDSMVCWPAQAGPHETV